jgi:tRNA (cytidine32/uridine32-2'-O)-methyltransferase
VPRPRHEEHGLDLVLVRPKLFPHPEPPRASGADDVLARAQVVETVAEALRDCGLVATTSRSAITTTVYDVRGGRTCHQRGCGRSVAILFGVRAPA